MGEVYRDVLTVISITQDGETSWKKYSAEQGIEGVNLRDPESLTGLVGALQCRADSPLCPDFARRKSDYIVDGLCCGAARKEAR